ncbi:MAG: FlgD immunoglobulin-like domain containing protein [Candidatus Latescibacterota bacterium]|nr:FlgD immunoglobulin-like domain containing protein [Candidatus Latescibacterota bacterium]
MAGGGVEAERISFNTRSDWEQWTWPVGAVEITRNGVQLVPVRKNTNAVSDISDFVGGGIRQAGSNSAQAKWILDGDAGTAWHPSAIDDVEGWFIEIDLGRVVTAREIRIQFAEDAEPLEFFSVLISNGEPVFTNALVPIEGTLVYGTSERFGFNNRYEIVIPLEDEPVRVVRLEAKEKTEGAGIAELMVSTPGDNIALGIIERGGSIELSTDQQQILSGAENLADGDLVTFWAMTTYHQTEEEGIEVFNRVFFDLGAQYWADHIFSVGDPVGAPTNRRSSFNNFFWYRISVSDGSLAPDGTLRWEEVAFMPHLQENLNEARRFEHVFALRRIRYVRHLFPSSQGGQRAPGTRFGLISEFQIYGEGHPAEVEMASPLIDMGDASNITAVSWDNDLPAGTRMEVRSRTGNEVLEEKRYFDKSGKEQTQRKWEKTPATLRGPVEVTRIPGGDWSAWSDPYVESGEFFRSPSPRDHALLHVRLFADDPVVAPTLSALHLEVGRPIAAQTRGEIFPAKVTPGEEEIFTYYVRSTFDHSSQGIDRLQLSARVPVEFVGLQIGDKSAVAVATEEGFRVDLPLRLRTEELVKLSFRSTIYQNQTRFDLFLVNDNLGQDIRQRVDAGDATEMVDSETISIALPVTGQVLSNLSLSSELLTPNGDGIGDEIRITFDLLKVMTPRAVKADVLDLAMRHVRALELPGSTAGRYTMTWDGTDERGNVVCPGSYLLRVRTEGDSRTQVINRIVAVAY